MSSERLEECEDNVRSLLRDVQALVSVTLPASRGGEESRRNLALAERKVQGVERELEVYADEVRRVPRKHQNQYSIMLSQFKHQLATIKRELASYSAELARSDLFTRDDSEYRMRSTGSEGYGRMMDNTETLYRASESLARARQVSAETDQVADDILVDLDDQKQSLLRTRSRVHGFDEQLDTSRSLLRKIACQMVKNRFVLIGVIVLELIVLSILTWWKFFSSS